MGFSFPSNLKINFNEIFYIIHEFKRSSNENFKVTIKQLFWKINLIDNKEVQRNREMFLKILSYYQLGFP